MLQAENGAGRELVKIQPFTKPPIKGKADGDDKGDINDERFKVYVPWIRIRLTKIPLYTQVRGLKSELSAIQCRPLDIMWEISSGSAILIYCRKQYPQKQLQDLLERLKRLPYQAELLSSYDRPISHKQTISPDFTSTATGGKRHPKRLERKNLFGGPNDKIVERVASTEPDGMETFSQLSLAFQAGLEEKKDGIIEVEVSNAAEI